MQKSERITRDFSSYPQVCNPTALQIPVEGDENECALTGLRLRTHKPASAHSRARDCALSGASVDTLRLMHQKMCVFLCISNVAYAYFFVYLQQKTYNDR